MPSNLLARTTPSFPSMLEDFFKPWNEWFETGGMPARMATIPAVNIVENNSDYNLSLAAPGMKKDDFNISIDGNMLTISSEQEDRKEEKEERYTRREYSYRTFSRSFALPENVKQEGIEARYENGVLQLTLPKKQTTQANGGSKKISIK